MSFDKNYPNRKDKRKTYRKAKAFDRSCRNHGSCPYCKDNRTFNDKKRRSYADADLQEWLREQDINDPRNYTIPERDFWPDINFYIDIDEFNPYGESEMESD